MFWDAEVTGIVTSSERPRVVQQHAESAADGTLNPPLEPQLLIDRWQALSQQILQQQIMLLVD